MATAIRTIGHDERLSVVDHLHELRVRLIVSAVALALVFGVCLWQNHTLLRFINRPLAHQTEQQVSRGEGPLGQTWLAQQGVREVARDTKSIARALSAPSSGLPAATRAQLAAASAKLDADIAKIPSSPSGNLPVTLGPGEPFTTTLTVALYFALVLVLPLILFELYGFVMPAFDPRERRAIAPLLVSIPFLFVAGVAFGYYVVLPAAVRFLQNFNSSQFNVMVQASQYYKFAATVLLAMGLSFQAPVAIVGAVRAGIVTPRQLRRNRRYAILVCAAIAAFLPGDAFTLVLETVPLYLLYEASILVASVVARRDAKRDAEPAKASGAGRPPEDDPPSSPGAPGSSGPMGPSPGEPKTTVQDDRPHQPRAELMLFDLRARGRRRTVQVVYVGLALLFLVGFVGFGVGVGGGGGSSPIEAIFGKSEANNASYAKQIAAAEARTKKKPAEAGGWAALAEARLHETAASEFYDESTQQFTSKGKQKLTKVVDAWNHYTALNPTKPTLTIAQDMLRVFGEEGLNQPAEAVAVLQLVIPTRPPSASLYGYLAKFAYQAKNPRVGDLASTKAVSLTPAKERKRVQAQLEELKKNPTGNPSNNVYTGTTNGKVYSVKVGPKGEGTVLKTTPTPTTPAKK